MRCIKHYFLVLLFFSATTILNAAKVSDWKTAFKKTEKYLIQGDYANSKKQSDQLFSFLQSHKSEAGSSAAQFQLARIYIGLGDFPKYDASCKEGLKYVNISGNEGQADYVFALLEGIKTYLDYGDLVNAGSLSQKGMQLTINNTIKEKSYAADIYFLHAKTLYEQGYLLKARALLAPVKQYKLSRIVLKEQTTDAKSGKTTQKKLSSTEQKARKRAYVDVLHLEVKILADNGLLASADSLYKIANTYISKELGSKDFSMVENLFIKGGIQEKASEDKEAYQFYTSALDLYATSKGMRYSHYCKETARLFHKAVLIEEKIGKGKEGSKDQVSYNSKIKRYFGKKNFYYGQTILLEIEKNIVGDNIDEEEKELQDLLSKSEIFPLLHPERARAYKLFYTIHLLEDDYVKAENDLSEIIRIKKAMYGESSPAYHKSLLDLAAFDVIYSNRFKEAKLIFDQSFSKVLSEEVDHHAPVYLDAAYNFVKFYQVTEQFGAAQKLMDNLLLETKKGFGADHVQYMVATEKSAILDIDLGKYAAAEMKLNTCINYYKTHNLNSTSFYTNYVNSHSILARLQIIEGNYEEAEKNLKKANKLSKQSQEYKNQRNNFCAEEIANLYMHTGNYQEATKILLAQSRRKEARLGKFSRNLINPYNQLGNLHLITGDYSNAERYVRKAQSISTTIFGDSSLKFAESLKLLVNIYTAIGDYEHAEEAIQKVVAIEVAKYGMNHALVANSLNDQALVKFLNKRRKDEVEKLFLQSLSILKTSLGVKTPQYAEVLKNLSLFYLETGRVQEAEKNLDQLSLYWTEKLGEENIHTAEIFMLQGNLLSIQNKPFDAKTKYTDAKNIYASIFDATHPHYVKAVSRIGQMNFVLGEYKTCIKNYDETTGIYLNFIKKYFPSLSEREKNKFWNMIKNDFEFYNSLAVKLKDSNPELIANVYDFALNTKALLLNSSIKVRERIVGSKDSVLIKKYEDWVAKKEYLVTILSMSLEQRKANEVDVKTVEKDIENMEKDLSASSELFTSNAERETEFTWQKVKDNLQANEVAVEIVRFRKFTRSFTDTIYYAALIVTPQTKTHPEIVLFENGHELETKFIKYYRNTMRLKTEDNYSFANFWQPLSKNIQENNTIYFSPDGVFSQINIETLKSPEGKYLSDRNDIVLVSNTRDLIGRTKQLKKKDAVDFSTTGVSLFGNPTYYSQRQDSIYEHGGSNNAHRTIAQLPGAEKEVKALFDLLNISKWEPKLYMENEAEEEIVKNLKSPKVFHIATHGFFLEDTPDQNEEIEGLEDRSTRNPLLRAGLLLRNGGKLIEQDNVYDFNTEDGILTAYEAMNLNLDKTDLVVLSACETGLGEVQQGEGVYGLQRAFQVAGAKSIVMSLFKVSDEVTQELMYNFYKKWISTGDKRKSFIAAKKEIKAKYPEPIYWGSFVMIGMN